MNAGEPRLKVGSSAPNALFIPSVDSELQRAPREATKTLYDLYDLRERGSRNRTSSVTNEPTDPSN